jgi:hypothetical protein
MANMRYFEQLVSQDVYEQRFDCGLGVCSWLSVVDGPVQSLEEAEITGLSDRGS